MPITLKLHMLAHRTSLFIDNNVVFTVYEQKAAMADAENLGKRTPRRTWDQRHKLCVAKLGPELNSSHVPGDFARLSAEARGYDAEDDCFVELHIWGPISIRSVQIVRVWRRGVGR